MPYKLWPIANLYLAWFEERFYKLLLQYIADLKVDWSRINFTVWYVKNKHWVECLFTGFLSPIRKWRRNQADANILWCLFLSFYVSLWHNIADTNSNFHKEMGHIILEGIKWNIIVIFRIFAPRYNTSLTPARWPSSWKVNCKQRLTGKIKLELLAKKILKTNSPMFDIPQMSMTKN